MMTLDSKDFQIIRLGGKDILLFQKLLKLFHTVFEMKEAIITGKEQLENLLLNPAFIAFTVLHGTEVTGGLTAYELPMYYADTSEIFIYDMAVLPAYQRKGLGKKLISAIKTYARERGVKEIFVSAHKSDQHALEFYTGAGGEAEDVVHFNFIVEK